MKHLHFTQSVEPLQGGGLGKAAIDLHKAFLMSGTKSLLVSTKETPDEKAIPESVIGLRTGPKKCFYSKTIQRKAAEWGKVFDVIHGHGFYVYPNWSLGAQARIQGKMLVYHPHGFLEPWILNRSKLPKHIAYILFENKNFAYSQLWRALTEKEADQIRSYGVTAPIVVAANGIHLTEYDRDFNPDLIPEKKKKRILFLARLHPKKGLRILLEIWPGIKRNHSDWEVIVAGPDEGGHRQELESLASSLQIEDSIKFVGTVSGDTKLAWLKSSDLFILPSYSEGFSVAVLEAMVCGIPVLATTGCNFPEIFHREAGWICEAEHASLSSALIQALESQEADLHAMGQNGRKLVENKYTWTKIATTIIDATHAHRG
ncbi:MAG: glycosyltransferase [Verrucomicrobia bacterium]|nr:glycosyltransferase [Verrucomicrobiota bacterium]